MLVWLLDMDQSFDAGIDTVFIEGGRRSIVFFSCHLSSSWTSPLIIILFNLQMSDIWVVYQFSRECGSGLMLGSLLLFFMCFLRSLQVYWKDGFLLKPFYALYIFLWLYAAMVGLSSAFQLEKMCLVYLRNSLMLVIYCCGLLLKLFNSGVQLMSGFLIYKNVYLRQNARCTCLLLNLLDEILV